MGFVRFLVEGNNNLVQQSLPWTSGAYGITWNKGHAVSLYYVHCWTSTASLFLRAKSSHHMCGTTVKTYLLDILIYYFCVCAWWSCTHLTSCARLECGNSAVGRRLDQIEETGAKPWRRYYQPFTCLHSHSIITSYTIIADDLWKILQGLIHFEHWALSGARISAISFYKDPATKVFAAHGLLLIIVFVAQWNAC